MDGISLSIQDLLNDNEYGLGLSLLAGEQGLSHRVSSSRIQKPGLALAGYSEHLHPDRVQVLGNTEISYLQQIDSRVAAENIAALCNFPISCFVVTKNLRPPQLLLDLAGSHAIPVLATAHQSSTFISLITKFLEEQLLPTTHLHGVLMDVLGVGVLISGKAASAKVNVPSIL